MVGAIIGLHSGTNFCNIPPVITTSFERESDGWMRHWSPRTGRATAITAGLLATLLTTAPAWATSGDAPAAEPAVNLHLDGHSAGRLLAASDSDSLEGGADKDAAAKGPAGENAGENAGKSDELKMTVTRGDGQKKKPADSGDSMAFLKDWPFWAIVGGVVLAGAATS